MVTAVVGPFVLGDDVIDDGVVCDVVADNVVWGWTVVFSTEVDTTGVGKSVLNLTVVWELVVGTKVDNPDEFDVGVVGATVVGVIETVVGRVVESVDRASVVTAIVVFEIVVEASAVRASVVADVLDIDDVVCVLVNIGIVVFAIVVVATEVCPAVV